MKRVFTIHSYHLFYYRSNRWNGQYRNDPIVVPMTEPEYTSSGMARREPDTIYLK